MMPEKNTTLTIKIDEEVFKLRYPKVDRLRSGKISVEVFVMSITNDDPFVLIGDTVYALTEEEYYALKAVRPVSDTSEQLFRSVVDAEDLSYMDTADAARIKQIQKELPTCSACAYKKHKEEVRNIARKYGISCEYKDSRDKYPPYPDVYEKVLPNVSNLTAHMYRVQAPVRKSCIDCVEKHIAQAWVTGNEAIMGYPEHLSVAIAHISEAIEETPVGFEALFRTLEYCLARTETDQRVFMPLQLILPLVAAARAAANSTAQTNTDAASTTLDLDISEDMLNRLSGIDEAVQSRLMSLLQAVDDFTLKYKNDQSDHNRIVWEGSLACAADLIAGILPDVSNVLRNRRLLFIGNPALMAEAGFGFGAVIKALMSSEHDA